MAGLNEYRQTVTSQWGEDGILAEIFRRITPQHHYCVEFGAWDGKHLSNVWSLWHDSGWSGLLIEADEARCAELTSAVSSFEGVTALHRRVSAQGADRLDAILDAVGAPQDPDLISIDVDGDDYHIVAALETHRPRCLVVEHNPTIPPHLHIVQQPGESFGCSARALLDLAHEKNYRLCACTETNCLFVADEVFAALGIEEPALEDVFPTNQLTYVISGYNGALHTDRVPSYRNRLKRKSRLRVQASKRRHPDLAGRDALIPIDVDLPPGGPRDVRPGS